MMDSPFLVVQAMSDRRLRFVDRVTLWHLLGLLDTTEYREVKTLALAHMLGIEDKTAGRSLRTLAASGYLDTAPRKDRGPRCYRLMTSRRPLAERAA